MTFNKYSIIGLLIFGCTVHASVDRILQAQKIQNGAGLFTIPSTGTDTFALLNATQVLTNKTMDATLNTFSNIPASAIAAGAGIPYSKLNLSNSIVNADINSSAAIERSKIASGTSNQVIVNDGSGFLSGVSPGSNGNILRSNGTVWASSAASSSNTTVQTFLSGSGTYTTPANVTSIKIRMIGGGGGGGGGGTVSMGTGVAGSDTTFGGSLLDAVGGAFGNITGNMGGSGGLPTNTGGPIILATIRGGNGGGGTNSGGNLSTGVGGSSAFGGNGGNAPIGQAGTDGATNSGGGGGGGAAGSGYCGGGGGSGGYIEAIINSPSATYSYVVGAGGSGGAAGTSGQAGGNGGSGIIIVEEHY